MAENEVYTRIYSGIEELPTLPAVIPRLLRAFDDKNLNTAGLAELISSDPSLTSKILKTANSAYYGFSQQIASLEYAAALLGFNMVKSLALSIGVMTSLPGGRGSAFFDPGKLWQHNIATARAMEKIAGKVKGIREDSPLFVIGLLHDIGKLVLDQFFNQEFSAALEQARTDDSVALHTGLKKRIGMDHNQVAAMLFQRWNFPDNIKMPIQLHHSKERFDSCFSLEISILRLGNSIARQADIGSDGNAGSLRIRDYDLENTGLGREDMDEITGELLNEKEAIAAFLG
ncbi:HDOD domain-containing protein [Desulfospira joergensenii]|uniref:HDOD domain-containing protein n=1 Tax=Desulfospira joergensenii TaxID=53329 RepID=UPI0003B4EC25|nr:HDOD domain-containing protein [Desulfospira joergensenii]